VICAFLQKEFQVPFLLGIVGIAAAVYFFVIRARNAANIATDVVDMANDVRLAARRFGFKRRTNLHPVEAIEDSKIAIAAVAYGFLELDDLPTLDQRNAFLVHIRAQFRITDSEAEELMILGRWLVSECGGPTPAVTRISRKLNKMVGAAALDPLLSIIQKTIAATGSTLSVRQKEALDDIKRAFRIA
jgi:hypothetical protein